MNNQFRLAMYIPLTAVICGLGTCQRNTAVSVTRSFEISGIVEGFYGTPWSHADRLDVITFMGDVGLNAYFYAPKADPYHRSQWREPYPPQEWERLRELSTAAQAHTVTFWYAISPGLTMQYSAEADYGALLAKIDAIATLGVRHFGLFLDDVPLELTNQADVLRFEDLANAHITLINRLHADFVSRGYTLAVTPTVYTSAWDSPRYIDRVGADVHPDVYMIWTGPDVVTSQITQEQSERWSSRLRRRLILWDNYPVNDFAPWRVFLGPVRGRDSILANSTLGILSNPMNQAHASMIPLFTLAEYVRDPQGYDPDASWHRAIEAILGDTAGQALRPFLDLFSDYAADGNFLEPLHFLRDTIDVMRIDRAVSRLDDAVSKARVMEDALTPTARNALDELEPIAVRARASIRALRRDSRYREASGVMTFNIDSEQFDVQATEGDGGPDGDLSQWRGSHWYSLRGPIAGEVALAADDQMFHIALRIRTDDITALEGSRVGEGTHVGLVLTHDEHVDQVTSEDLFVLIAPRGSAALDPHFVGAMRLEGFMAKWLADNENLTFTDFHLTTLGDTAIGPMADVARDMRFASRRTATGFTMEIQFPHRSRDQRLSLTVSTRSGGRLRSSSLARRNYPLNPKTFVELRLPDTTR